MTCSGVENLGVLAEDVVGVLEIDALERLMTGVEKRRERRGIEGRQGAGGGGERGFGAGAHRYSLLRIGTAQKETWRAGRLRR